MAMEKPSLKGRALRLLSTREHSRAELERKLQSFEEEQGTLARALDQLQEKGFINEQRVLESVIYRRAGKLGTTRIKQELQSKGLDPAAIGEALAGLQATEHERAQAVWEKKFGAPPQDARELARQLRFMASRGFGAEVIRRVVGGAQDD